MLWCRGSRWGRRRPADVEAGLRAEPPDHIGREAGQALLEAAHQVCPYSNATRGNIPVELVIEEGVAP
ncbi:hypothetical protein AB0K12_35180 [Nonomuraea sp. NPDC049419]|uniref:hypothetical protein n=1 Tax=Nonomuraea sp. NPDC049419 TaxID=3155772 RepID=UPI003448E36E